MGFTLDIDVPLGRQSPCFLLCRGREVERQDVETLFSQPDPVASLAIGDGQRPT